MLRDIIESSYFQENPQHYLMLATMLVTLMILVQRYSSSMEEYYTCILTKILNGKLRQGAFYTNCKRVGVSVFSYVESHSPSRVFLQGAETDQDNALPAKVQNEDAHRYLGFQGRLATQNYLQYR